MGAPGLDFETWDPSRKCRQTFDPIEFSPRLYSRIHFTAFQARCAEAGRTRQQNLAFSGALKFCFKGAEFPGRAVE